MKIITISREFGSGGRELGKRLADHLGFDYYDREIIMSIAKNKGLDETYVFKTLQDHGWQTVPLSFRKTFGISPCIDLLVEQTQVIKNIAELGNDCVIVGRNADVLLAEYHPLNLFVCAAPNAKIQRCMERAANGEKMTVKDIERQMHRIDKERARTRELLTGSTSWGVPSAYHLVINTTDWEIKELIPAIGTFANFRFSRGAK